MKGKLIYSVATEDVGDNCPGCNDDGFTGKGTTEILPCLKCFGLKYEKSTKEEVKGLEDAGNR